MAVLGALTGLVNTLAAVKLPAAAALSSAAPTSYFFLRHITFPTNISPCHTHISFSHTYLKFSHSSPFIIISIYIKE